MSGGKRYWNEVAGGFLASRSEWLWRMHSDAVNERYFDGALSGPPVDLLLKTDLFDEALGEGLHALSRKHARGVVGIDVSEPIIQEARSRHPGLNVAGSDVRSLPFEDERFDIVLSNSTLDHFSATADIRTALRELYRVLRPSGRLLLTLDNPVNPVLAIRQVFPFRVLRALGIVPYVTGPSLGPLRLKRALAGVGFRVCGMGCILHCPRFPAVTLCRAAARYGRNGTQRRLLEGLMAFERMSRLPTRYVTGHFIFADAVRT